MPPADEQPARGPPAGWCESRRRTPKLGLAESIALDHAPSGLRRGRLLPAVRRGGEVRRATRENRTDPREGSACGGVVVGYGRQIDAERSACNASTRHETAQLPPRGCCPRALCGRAARAAGCVAGRGRKPTADIGAAAMPPPGGTTRAPDARSPTYSPPACPRRGSSARGGLPRRSGCRSSWIGSIARRGRCADRRRTPRTWSRRRSRECSPVRAGCAATTNCRTCSRPCATRI